MDTCSHTIAHLTITCQQLLVRTIAQYLSPCKVCLILLSYVCYFILEARRKTCLFQITYPSLCLNRLIFWHFIDLPYIAPVIDDDTASHLWVVVNCFFRSMRSIACGRCRWVVCLQATSRTSSSSLEPSRRSWISSKTMLSGLNGSDMYEGTIVYLAMCS